MYATLLQTLEQWQCKKRKKKSQSTVSYSLHSNAHRPKTNVAQVKRRKCYAENQHRMGLECGISYGMLTELL